MELPIDQIREEKRIRKNLGDLSELMKSMRQLGLMNPLLVDQEYRLIAGGRRLEAARRMGWTKIAVRVVPGPGTVRALEMEIDENLHRKALTPDELADACDRLRRLQNPHPVVKLLRSLKGAVQRGFDRLFRR